MNKKALEDFSGLVCSASISAPSRAPSCTAEAGKVLLDSVASKMPYVYFFIFIFFISWRLITLQYCSGNQT